MTGAVPRETPGAPTADSWSGGVASAVAAAGLAEDTSDLQQQQLAAFLALLGRWNSTYNLTALRGKDETLSHHLADCLAVIPPLKARWAGFDTRGERVRILDVGSGGGLPGVVLAILCPEADVTCVDAVGKKAAFVRQVAVELRLPNLRAEHLRVQQLQGRFHVVTSRAFASLCDFTAWTAHLLAPGGCWMAMKGRHPEDELDLLPATVHVEQVQPLEVPGLAAERCLVWMHHA